MSARSAAEPLGRCRALACQRAPSAYLHAGARLTPHHHRKSPAPSPSLRPPPRSKWAFAPKGVAVLYAAARHQGADVTQAAVVSHFYQKSFARRFWMQGTNDQSRLLATGAALRFCEARLGGFAAMRAYNSALVDAGAQLLCAAWGTRRMYDASLSAPFLAVVEVPLDWRRWVRVAPTGAAGAAAGNAVRMEPAAALAALDADEGFAERISEAVLFGYGINGVFWAWTVNGEKRLFTRVSAQCYNVLEDYAALAVAVLDLARKEAAERDAEAGTK